MKTMIIKFIVDSVREALRESEFLGRLEDIVSAAAMRSVFLERQVELVNDRIAGIRTKIEDLGTVGFLAKQMLYTYLEEAAKDDDDIAQALTEDDFLKEVMDGFTLKELLAFLEQKIKPIAVAKAKEVISRR